MLKIRNYLEIAKLAQMYVETNGMTYKEAIEKAKELIGSERVGAHVDSDSINSKTFKDSISEKEIKEN